MSERAYTVSELDALRSVVENKWLFGTYGRAMHESGIAFSRSYNDAEKAACVEALVRTHMLAGHSAEDLLRSEEEGMSEITDEERLDWVLKYGSSLHFSGDEIWFVGHHREAIDSDRIAMAKAHIDRCIRYERAAE